MDRLDGYAAAAFNLAVAEGESERVESELFSVARAVDASKPLRDALADPRLPTERKQMLLNELLKGRASAVTVNFLALLAAQGRSGDLGAIVERLVEKAAASREKVVAEVRSAVPLDQATIDRLTAAIGKATRKRVEVKAIVDSDLLGGIVAQVGDVVIDGSIRHRLQSMRETLQRR